MKKEAPQYLHLDPQHSAATTTNTNLNTTANDALKSHEMTDTQIESKEVTISEEPEKESKMPGSKQPKIEIIVEDGKKASTDKT